MAYAALYEFNFLSTNGKDILIRINADGYVGSVKSRHVGGAPQLRLEQNGNIKGMSLEFPAECEIEDEYASLYTSNPYKFLVELEVESTVVWRGFITPELYSSPWIDPPYDVTLTATDGLGELKMHTFPAFGQQSLEALFSTLLEATGLNLPIKMVSTLENDGADELHVLASSAVNLDAFTGKTYYDVLDALLTSIHATIQQREGAWLIIRETDITSRTDDGEVSDTSGRTYDIEPFGTMRENESWPVGRLRMEIVPAKNSVKVSAANHFPESIFPDPEMVVGGWSGDGRHYSSDGGFYALERYQSIYQSFVPAVSKVSDLPDYFQLKFKARQSGYQDVALDVKIQVFGTYLDGQPGVTSWYVHDGSSIGYWSGSADESVRFRLPAANHGNATDCQEYTLDIKGGGDLAYAWRHIDEIRFTFLSTAKQVIVPIPVTIYIHSAYVSPTSVIEGVNTRLVLDNNARGGAPDVEPAFADTYEGNRGLSLITNAVKVFSGGIFSEVSEWKSDAIPFVPYGEFLAKDHALSVANPRVRLQGKLNVPSSDLLPALFFSTGGINYAVETWNHDLLNDEAEVSLVSLPASAIQVVSVRQTAYGEDGYEEDAAVSVFPASFTIPADDTTTRYYIAVSAPANMSWTVEDIPNWITIDSQSGTGSGTVSFLATLNAGIARQAVMMVAGVPVSIYQSEAGGEHSLTFNISPSDGLTIAMTVDGETAVYSAGMMVESGKVVNVTISKQGYSTLNDSFNMPGEDTIKYYTLSENIEATITPVDASITQPSQNVSYTISDPSGHGWTLDFDGPDSYSRVTGAGVTSGIASVDGTVIRGTGNAIVYLTVPANPNAGTRTIDNYPFQFKDKTTNTTTPLSITQLGTSSSQVLVTGITLNKNSMSLAAGTSEKLTATVLPSNATNKNLTWRSSNTNYVQVGQDGTVHAIAAGSASVIASATDGSGKSASCTVTVTGANIPVTGITVDKTSLTVGVGLTGKINATIQPTNATNKNVIWSSGSDSVATVDGDGLVTGVHKGTVRVDVTTADGRYTASCFVRVTSNGTMSAANASAKSAATTASTALTQVNMDASTMMASCAVGWVTGVTVDTTGSPWRVRMTILTNVNTTARTATVNVSGQDLAGETVNTSFILTQTGKTSSDVPVTSMLIEGSSTIQNMKNESTYDIAFDPSTTTQNKVTWSIVGGAVYAEVAQSTDTSCLVRVFSQANGQTVTLKAVNYYNGEIVATKNIVVSYMEPSPNVGVNPSSVIVDADDTTDNTPVVTSSNLDVNTFTTSVNGFIQSASISQGRVIATFAQNTGAERYGQVTLYNGSTRVGIISYTQRAAASAAYGINIEAINVRQTTDELGRPAINARFLVAYSNPNAYDDVLPSITATLVGYSASDAQVLTKTWQMPSKTVAALSTETELYDETWQATLPTVDHYTLTVTCSTVTDSYTSDGSDPIN